MGKFDGFLICTDIDGTLTCGEMLSKENAEAIRYFQSEGGLFTVSTGRFPDYVYRYAEDFVPNTYVISVNGTVLYDLEKNRIVLEYYMDREEICSAIEKVITSGKDFESVVAGSFGDPSYEFYSELDTLRNEEGYLRRECGKDHPDVHFHKAIFMQENEIPFEYADKYEKLFDGKYSFSRSWSSGLEMIPAGSGKGVLMNKLAEQYGGRIHTKIAVGDYDNDISMIKAADIGYAVENANDNVKAVADRITVSCDRHAIAAIISDIEKM